MGQEDLAGNGTVALAEHLKKHEALKEKGKAANTIFSLNKEEPIIVHPASETPRGLYFLSNLDQIVPIPIEMVMSFKGDGKKEGESEAELLKEALRKILVEFYPMAGRLAKDNKNQKVVVACTGEGIPFVKADSKDNMDILGDLSMMDPTKFRQLVYYNDNIHDALDLPMLTVQVTKFKCGGIIIGAVMNHVLMDGKALVDFLICWSELVRGDQRTIQPFIDRSILSARQTPKIEFAHSEYTTKIRRGDLIPLDSQKPLAHKSFCLTPSMISHLKKSVREDGFTRTPTTFQVISALVWTLHAKACGIKPNETTKALITVDGRPRFKPPMPKGFFGNGIGFSCAKCLAGDLLEKPFSFAVQLVHDSLMEVTESYIRSAIDYIETAKAGFVELENVCYITKWSRLGFEDIDFGWGKPVQVAPTSTIENLVVVLSQKKDSENIIFSLGLPCASMKAFDELFLSRFNHIDSI